ncbi:SDR family NAD(P)-dependent oxidoreductase [uncultured Williamsia sp.]|uniref:SDR family NAD(P)-dependent oxidoreductase n=1 Tax=uncultured Williamsia sp. TaxID=259311 RepID=UPI0026042DC4|nr:SDR family NAD(P)-dependent oxidoreductase [uncultured Williamsia sp.]
MSTTIVGDVLIIGASRGLGAALVAEWVSGGRRVVATTRGGHTPLDEFAAAHPDHVEIENVDVTDVDQIAALRGRLDGRSFGLLFVNAGVTDESDATVAEVSTDEFTRLMVTNALSPLRVIDALEDLVSPGGMIGVMSSGQGSVANNTRGGHEVYRASKAALNTLVRSWAARRGEQRGPIVLMAPGWVRTELGGAGARLTVDESIPGVVATLDSLADRPGVHYVDYLGRTVPW